MSIAIRAVILLALLLAVSGCNTRRAAWQLGLGSWTTDLMVERVVTRGPYLDAWLAGHGLAIRTFTLDSEVCRSVLTPEETVWYVDRGVGGRFDREDEQCHAVGIGEPLITGARSPRRRSRGSPVPRGQARFEIIHTDEEVALLHGRFPLVGAVGWARGDDSVAVIPNTPACSRPMEGGIATLEYRASGRNTFTLVSPHGRCRIEGLILPPPAAAAYRGEEPEESGEAEDAE